MSQKEKSGCLLVPIEVFRSIFGRNGWLVANWLRLWGKEMENGIDLAADGPQTREGLINFLDGFAERFSGKKISVDDADFLNEINRWSGVEIKGEIPNLDGLIFMIGNYVGREPETAEDDPYLEPTIYGLLKLFQVMQDAEAGNAIVVARDTTFDDMDPRLKGAVGSHVAFARKDSEKGYQLLRGQGFKLHRLVKSGKGLLWTAPAATTNDSGLKLEDLTTTTIRQAMEKEARLMILAIETDKIGIRTTSIQIKEILLPRVVFDPDKKINRAEKKELLRRINHHILLWSLAQVAECLPKDQRGHFEKAEICRKDAVACLLGICEMEGVTITGGFMGE